MTYLRDAMLTFVYLFGAFVVGGAVHDLGGAWYEVLLLGAVWPLLIPFTVSGMMLTGGL